MVDEQVDVGAVVLGIPGEHVGLGSLEHDVLEPELGDDEGDDVGPPFAHPAPPEQPGDVGAGEAAAQDEGSVSGCTRAGHLEKPA